MSPVLLVGITILAGFLGGELARRLGLPKVTGFILAGVLLNPTLTGFIPEDFTEHTDLVTNIALSFITFSVGGTLLWKRIRGLGKGIVYITLFEAEFAFLVTFVGVLAVAPLLITTGGAGWATTFIPIALLMGCLASPTDPSATLAVVHQYNSKGIVTSTILGVAAFDDVLGIINYSIAIAMAQILLAHTSFHLGASVGAPVWAIAGAVGLGILAGGVFNLLLRLIGRETEGVLIVVVLAMLSLCFGVATLIGVDELLATMTMGAVAVNFSTRPEKVFKVLGRYTEELVFVLFFTLSGMHLDFSVLAKNVLLVVCFIVLRSLGKGLGAVTGATLAGAPGQVRKYVAGGLIPQGGIVIGLALLMRQNPAFDGIADIVISVVIGATVVHELLGPILSRAAIGAAGEIPADRRGS